MKTYILNENLYKQMENILSYANSNIDAVLDKRLKLLKNDIRPTKILIPKSKLYGMDIEFADIKELTVIGDL